MARHQDEEKRRRILDGAFITFGEKGYRNTTIKEIADKAGVAAGSVYTYFADKEMLFKSTVEDGWERFIAELNGATAQQTSYEEKLSTLIEIGFLRLKEAYPLLKGIFCEANRMKIFQKNMDQLCGGILEVFKENDTAIYQDRRMLEERNFFIKIVISGILFNTALTGKEELDLEIMKMKDGIINGFLVKKGSLV